MPFYAPDSANRYVLHVYDQLLEFDAIDRGDIDDDVTQELIDQYDPIWWMHALEILAEFRTAVESDIARCIAEARSGDDDDIDEDESSSATPTWEEIGKQLGVTAQAAQQRYGRRRPSLSRDPRRRVLPVPTTRTLAPEHASHRPQNDSPAV